MPVSFYVRRYAPLQVTINAVNPFDDNDAFKFYLYQVNTPYIGRPVISIQNAGLINQPHGYPAYEDGLNPYWIGKDVHSIIHCRVQEGAMYRVDWTVRKNGVTSSHSSPLQLTSLTTMNSWTINY